MSHPTRIISQGGIGDGRDDDTAATSLPLTVSSIRTVREALHRKFGVQHKGQLIDRAAEYGFVIRTKTGIVRPGLKTLIAAHRSPTPMPSHSAIESVAKPALSFFRP